MKADVHADYVLVRLSDGTQISIFENGKDLMRITAAKEQSSRTVVIERQLLTAKEEFPDPVYCAVQHEGCRFNDNDCVMPPNHPSRHIDRYGHRYST